MLSESCSRCWHNHTYANGLECHCRCHSHSNYDTGTGTGPTIIPYEVTCGNITDNFVIHDFHKPIIITN